MRSVDTGKHQSPSDISLRRWQTIGWAGVLLAVPFFLWLPLTWLGLAPSMIEVFGIVGLRIPAGVTIAGLLLAAVGFHKL